VLYALWEVAVVGLINKPVIAVIELILHTRKEDLAIGLAQRILVISRDIQTFGLLSAIESRPKQVIWLHLLGRWQPEWRKIRFTGVTTMLRFLEAEKWDFVGLVIVWERKSDQHILGRNVYHLDPRLTR
jgi:hypothetical protein